MRILVSFKVTPDLEALREADWEAGAAHGVDTRYVRRVLNCFDESALELALRLSDTLAARDLRPDLGALTVAGKEAEPHLKTLQALGYARAARVQTEAALDFAPAVTASVIAGYARRVDRSDLLMLGCRCDPGDSGTVPFLVAESLGWPCLTQVVEIEPLTDGRLRVACTADDGLLRVTVRPPCVVAVGNAVVSRLRVPTLSDRLAHKHERMDVLEATDLGLDISAELRRETCLLTSLETIDRSRRGVVVGGSSPRDKARTLFDSHLKTLIDAL
jgi:electron transfer flavoprotein beta subunit